QHPRWRRFWSHPRRRNPCPWPVAARIAHELLASTGDPHLVAGGVQLHPLMHELERRTVEASAVAQIPVGRHPHGAAKREVKRLRRQQPERPALLVQPLSHDELAGGVPAAVRDEIAPVGIDTIELAQGPEPPRWPE